MDRVIFLVILLLVAAEARHRHHLKFPKVLEKVYCSNEHEAKRNKLMEQAMCGPPKDVFEPLQHNSKAVLIIPSAVWVKKCVGTCDYETGFSCQPTETRKRYIPVRLYDETTRKQSCALFPVEEHVSCACCALSAEKCATPRVFNARKCACSCPEPKERTRCLAQPNMKWNHSNCQCEKDATEKLR